MGVGRNGIGFGDWRCTARFGCGGSDGIGGIDWFLFWKLENRLVEGYELVLRGAYSFGRRSPLPKPGEDKGQKLYLLPGGRRLCATVLVSRERLGAYSELTDLNIRVRDISEVCWNSVDGHGNFETSLQALAWPVKLPGFHRQMSWHWELRL